VVVRGVKVGGSPIEYLARMRGFHGKVRGQDYLQIASDLARMVGLELPHEARTPEEIEHLRVLESRRELLGMVALLSIEEIWSERGEDARRYLAEKRGFREDDIRELQLGLYPSIDRVREHILSCGLDLKVAKASGLISPKYAGMIVFPWLDDHGALLTLYFRYPAKENPDGPKTMALPGEDSKRSPLYLDRAIRAGHKDIVVVEGTIDAALAQVRGDSRVVACVAAQLSREQVRTLVRAGIEEVTICLDPDTGGDTGSLSCVKSLEAVEINTRVAPRLPDGLDPDEFILRFGIEGWHTHLAAAISGRRFRVEALASERGIDAAEDAIGFLDAAEGQGLERDAADYLLDRWMASSDDGEQLVKDALANAAIMRSLAKLIVCDRARFEFLMGTLRERGAKARSVDSLKGSAQSERKKRKKAHLAPKYRELLPVPSELGAPIPEGLVIPAGVTVRRDGLYADGDDSDGKPTRISPSPIFIRARYRDIEEGKELVDLVWLRDGRWRTHVAERGHIASAKDIVALAHVGLTVTSITARDLVEYLAAFEQVNLHCIRPQAISRQLGWVGEGRDRCFLWGRTLITREGRQKGEDGSDGSAEEHIRFQALDRGEDQIVDGFRSEGDFTLWKRTVEVLRDYPRAMIAVIGSLSAPLISLVRAPNAIISYSSRTSQGKTTILRVAASVWGVADETDLNSLVRSWDSTRVFIERFGAMLNSLPLHLDETSLARNRGRDIANVIYSIVEGQSRGRGSTVGMRRSGRWATVALSTGEQPLASFTEEHGGTPASSSSGGLP